MKRSLGVVAVSLLASLALGLAACGSSDDGEATDPAGAESTTETPTDEPETSDESTATTPAETATEEPEPVGAGNAYFPIAIGNTWTYSITYDDPIGEVTQVDEITAVEEKPDGTHVTFSRDFTYENGAFPDFDTEVVYVVGDDGGLVVPYQTTPVAGTEVVVKEGGIVWPSQADLDAGVERTGTAVVEATTEGAPTQTVTLGIAVKGAGKEDVTVPAGSFTGAQVIDQDLDVSVEGLPAADITASSKIFFAPDVGIVKSSVGGLGPNPIDSVLVSYDLR